MARRVVALPPVMVTKPSTPSVAAWSKHLKVRDSSRPPPVAEAPISGRAADQAARSAALATAGTSLAPSRYMAWTCSSGTSRSSGSSTVQALVPTIDNPRWGTTMSPSPAGCRRLTTRSHSRPTSASSTPVDGWTGTVAPVTARPAVSSPVTSVNGRSWAPLRRAVAKNRGGSRMASMVASGTHTAALSAGFRPGSTDRASAAVNSRAGMPQAAQPARNRGR